MITGESLAKKAFENAITNVRDNCKKLEEFATKDVRIESKKDFIEFAEKLGNESLAKSYCLLKFGKQVCEIIDDE